MYRLSESQIDWTIRRRDRILLAGVGLIALALALPRGWGCGGLTGFMLRSLSIYGFPFRRWRTEPGLWMLAVFLTLLLTPCWLYFEYLHLQPFRKLQIGQAFAWDRLRLWIDATLSLAVFTWTIRFAVGIAIGNWPRTKSSP